MIKYLKRVKLASGEEVLTLASDEEVEKELDAIREQEELEHQRDVEAGGLQLRRANNSVAIREEEARLKNRSFTAEERVKHEGRLESLKSERVGLEKESALSIERLQQARQKSGELKKNFKDTRIPIKVVSLEDILKLKGGNI